MRTIIAGVSSSLRGQVNHFLKQLIVLGVPALLGVALLTYAIDYFGFHYRVAANRQPFGQVTVSSYDAVQQKNGKTEFIFNPPEQQTCVHTLFSHAGFLPCWYLQRHTEPRTDI